MVEGGSYGLEASSFPNRHLEHLTINSRNSFFFDHKHTTIHLAEVIIVCFHFDMEQEPRQTLVDGNRPGQCGQAGFGDKDWISRFNGSLGDA